MSGLVRLLAEQRKRCVATILSGAEASTWWGRLSASQQDQFRDQVRSAVAVFYDLARDMIKVADEDSVRNDLAAQLIRAVHQRDAHQRDEHQRGGGQRG